MNSESTKYRADIVKELKKTHPDMELDQLERIVDLILEEMSTGLSCGDRVEIRGFGSMSIRNRSAGTARNPRNGASVTVGDRAALYFRPSRQFIETLNNPDAANSN